MKRLMLCCAMWAATAPLRGGEVMIPAVYKKIFALIPTDRQPWMTLGDCRLVRSDEEWPSLYFVDKYTKPGEKPNPDNIYGRRSVNFALPDDPNGTVPWNETVLRNRIELREEAGGGKTIFIDSYKRSYDTGGYFTRYSAVIAFDKAGNLKGFDASSYDSSHLFLFWGKFKNFSQLDRVACGTVPAS